MAQTINWVLFIFQLNRVIPIDTQPLNLRQDWYASGDEKFDSMGIFNFTPEENTDQGMQLIGQYNEKEKNRFAGKGIYYTGRRNQFLRYLNDI